jgi:transcriptional regulator with XRE-family HTH domain
MVAYRPQIHQSAAIKRGVRDQCEMPSDPINEFIGARVKARRINLGIDASDFASSLSVTVQHLEAFEAGAKPIGPATLQRMGQMLFVSPMYFFKRDARHPPATENSPEKLDPRNDFERIADSGLREEIKTILQSLIRASSKYQS